MYITCSLYEAVNEAEKRSLEAFKMRDVGDKIKKISWTERVTNENLQTQVAGNKNLNAS